MKGDAIFWEFIGQLVAISHLLLISDSKEQELNHLCGAKNPGLTLKLTGRDQMLLHSTGLKVIGPSSAFKPARRDCRFRAGASTPLQWHHRPRHNVKIVIFFYFLFFKDATYLFI